LVYTSLEHLVSRKLVSAFENKGKKHFSITSPEILIEEFDTKKRVAEEVVSSIKKKLGSDLQEITVHQGNEEYLNLLTSLTKQLPKDATQYVLGTGDEKFMEETMIPIWKKYHLAVKEARINIKMIAYRKQKESIQTEINNEGMYQVKYLLSGNENPAGIHIYPEAGVVLNIIYSDKNKPVMAIKIKDKDLVLGYMNLFNNLWGAAK
jgi:uncharacterized UBP type Zn finger protein